MMAASTVPARAGKRLAARLLAAAAGAVIGSGSLAAAHPDIAVEDRVTFLFKDARVTAVEETWTFDAGYSQSFLSDYKTERGGSISAAESKVIADADPAQPRGDSLFYLCLAGRPRSRKPRGA